MRLYGTEGGFARREGAPVWRGEVCLFAPAELEAVRLPALVRLLLPAQARYCRAGTEGAALVGAVKRSAGSFTFALWEGNLAVCDEGDFVQGVLDGLLGRPLTAGGALCAALAALLPPETGAVEALEARAEKLETEALTEAALTSNRFGGKLLGVRKQVSALARYCAQLEDMFEDIGDAAQEAARTGVAVVTTIHSMSCEATYRRMVSLCKRAVDMSDDTLMGFVTEAYPIVAFCKQLENKDRRLMEIMECEILPDGTRSFRPLFQYQIKENRVEDGKFIIEGEHRQVNPISDSLARRFLENGMPLDILNRLRGGASAQGKGEETA